MLLSRLLRAASRTVSLPSPELLAPWAAVGMRDISTSPSTKASGDGRSGRSGRIGLGRRMLNLLYPRRSAVTVLQKWAEEGYSVEKFQLKGVIRQLRKHKRFHHALEICEWMQSQASIELLPGDYAVHLDLVAKVHGLENAEKFFEDLPPGMKQQSAYTTLLHLYSQHKLAAKAEALLQEMSARGFLTCCLPFNHMIHLYISTGEPEKAAKVVQNLKKNASPNQFTYNLWLGACADRSDVEGAEEAMLDMADRDVAADHVTYSILTSIYIKAGRIEKAKEALEKMEERVSRDHRPAFSYLITMHAALSDVAGVRRIWARMKSLFRKLTDAEYKCMIVSLLKFDLADDAARIYSEWEKASGTKDARVFSALLAYYAKNDIDKAEKFSDRAIKAGFKLYYSCWEILAVGYVRSNRVDQAIRSLREGLSSVKKWEPNAELVGGIFAGLERAGDVDGAERFLGMLRGAGYVTTAIYNAVLRTYAESRKMPLVIRERMEKDGVEPDGETRRLLGLTSKFGVGSAASLLV